MRLITIISFLVFELLTVPVKSASYSVINQSRTKSNFTTETINDKEYIQFSKLSEIFFGNHLSNHESNEISYQNCLIRFAPASFFVLFECSDNRFVGQMNLPALIIRNELLIPFHSFISVLNKSQLMNAKWNEKTIELSQYKFPQEQQKPKAQAPIADSQIKDMEIIDKDSETKMVNPINDSSQKDIKPDHYMIPDKLYRRKIDTKRADSTSINREMR